MNWEQDSDSCASIFIASLFNRQNRTTQMCTDRQMKCLKCGAYLQWSVIQPTKERKSWHRLKYGWSWRYYAKTNRPRTKGQVLYDPTYMRDLKQVYSQSIAITLAWWVRKSEELLSNRYSFLLEWQKFWKWQWQWLHDMVTPQCHWLVYLMWLKK